MVVIFVIIIQFGYAQITNNWCIIRQINGNTNANSADFSPDGQYLASAHRNGNVYIWNTISWTTISTIVCPSPIAEAVTVRFSKDGSKLAIGYMNARLSIISSTNWILLYTTMTTHIRIR